MHVPLRTAVLLLLGLVPAVAHAASVTLTWDPGAGSTQTGYVLERRVPPDAYSVLARVAAPPYTDSALPTLRPFCYQMRAFSALGVSEPSNELCLNLPGVPVNVTVTVSGGGALASAPRTRVTTTVRRTR